MIEKYEFSEVWQSLAKWYQGQCKPPPPPPHVHSTKLNIVVINFIMQKSEGEYKITKLCDCEIDFSRENNQVLSNASPWMAADCSDM